MNPVQPKKPELGRVESLKSLQILDTPAEEAFDRLARLTAKVFDVPICLISLIDENRAWFKSAFGLTNNEIAREISFCTHAMEATGVFVVANATQDYKFAVNPMVMGGARVRFYAGVRLNGPNGFPIGALGIKDRKPRSFSVHQGEVLKEFAKLVESEIAERTERLGKAQTTLGISTGELASANRKLAEAKAKSETLLKNIGDGIISINQGGEILYINERAEKMLGWSQKEVAGKFLIHAIRLEDNKEQEVPAQKRPVRSALLSKKRVVNNKYFIVRKDGTKFPAAITASPVVAYEQVTGGVIVFRDITKEKEVDRMKTEFISLASHQLRTPLSAMKWFTEILLDEDVGALNLEQKKIVNDIHKSNQRLIELVNALLNISRIESGRLIIDPKPTDLVELVNEVITELKPEIDKKKHKLKFSLAEELPKVNLDPKLTRHVYMNLLTNANKYTQEGGEITILISKKDGNVVSQISDNGFGIPKHQQERVFKKFFRGENIVKKVTDGTGLGLYLVYIIIQSSGGKIWYESQEGVGTTFWFSLPIEGVVAKRGEVSLD